MLSVVMAARNDNYGGNFLHRIQTFVSTLATLARRHGLDAELVVVEWNPPADRPGLVDAITWPEGLRTRIITVPPEVHRMLEGSDRMPMFEYVAKNVGIRCAAGDRVLVTNPDIIFSEEMIRLLVSAPWGDNDYGLASRTDVPGEVPTGPVDERLEFCRAHTAQSYGHGDAPGDFMLMRRDRWLDLQGYPEFLSNRTIDSYMAALADGADMRRRDLVGAIYHQDHHRNDAFGRPQIQSTLADELIGIRNKPGWGLEAQQLPERVVSEGGPMISIMVPTRGRVAEFTRMLVSARVTATNPVEVVAYVDDDDPALADYQAVEDATIVNGPRIVLTQCWNECIPSARGQIFMQGNDDMVFRTPGWDVMVEEAFAEFADHILMVHGHDVPGYGHGDTFGPFPFVHRRWTEILGYFIAPYFSSDYGDAWVNDLANQIDRRRCLPFEVEHLHYSEPYRKAPLDRTYQERLDRGVRDDVGKVWSDHAQERRLDADKLRAATAGAGVSMQCASWIRSVLALAPELAPALALATPAFAPPQIFVPPSQGSTRTCPRCGSKATAVSNGVTRCNQCAHQF